MLVFQSRTINILIDSAHGLIPWLAYLKTTKDVHRCYVKRVYFLCSYQRQRMLSETVPLQACHAVLCQQTSLKAVKHVGV